MGLAGAGCYCIVVGGRLGRARHLTQAMGREATNKGHSVPWLKYQFLAYELTESHEGGPPGVNSEHKYL